jgi:hypothetical protein
MFSFSHYKNSGYASANQGYYSKLKNLGVIIDRSLPKITEQEVNKFLDEEYDDFFYPFPVAPVASCSYLCGHDPLVVGLEELFGCKAYTIYGYIKTPVKNYHYFDDVAVRRALSGEIFDNHHAWFQFANGQLLDLVFMNTLRVANKLLDVTENKFEFILSDDGSNVGTPFDLSIVETITPNSFFRYVPMFHGKMFDNNALEKRAIATNNMVGWIS